MTFVFTICKIYSNIWIEYEYEYQPYFTRVKVIHLTHKKYELMDKLPKYKFILRALYIIKQILKDKIFKIQFEILEDNLLE